MSVISSMKTEMREDIRKMDKKITSISGSLKEVGGNLSNLEKRINKKINSVTESLSKMKERALQENTDIWAKIRSLEDDLKEEKKKNDGNLQEIEKLKADTLGLNPGNSDHLEKQYGELHRWKVEVTDGIMTIKSVALGNKYDIQIGKTQYEQLDNKIRIKNITINGLIEEEG